MPVGARKREGAFDLGSRQIAWRGRRRVMMSGRLAVSWTPLFIQDCHLAVGEVVEWDAPATTW